MDPRNALAAYRASCKTNAQQIKHFLSGQVGFALGKTEVEELEDTVGILLDQVDGMENAWEDILELVQQFSIDTRKSAILGEWSRLVASTRKIVERTFEISDRFQMESSGHWDPSLDVRHVEYGGDFTLGYPTL